MTMLRLAALLIPLLAQPGQPVAQGRVADARVALPGFAIDRTEVTIGRFRAFALATSLKTQAERAGHGYEYGAGWERRPGWSWQKPFGAADTAEADARAPAVHLSWSEARDFCAWAGGRLPTRAEWQEAAYRERRETPDDGFAAGKAYPYPVGDSPEGMNLSGADPWPRHAPAGATKRGVNGLHEMGGNVWEWLADRRGDDALTAGGSWWYGPRQTRADGMQWKAADFYAVYVGFRCVYAKL
jgi:formylglycine-generating enzyme required for sulfatase activity